MIKSLTLNNAFKAVPLSVTEKYFPKGFLYPSEGLLEGMGPEPLGTSIPRVVVPSTSVGDETFSSPPPPDRRRKRKRIIINKRLECKITVNTVKEYY